MGGFFFDELFFVAFVILRRLQRWQGVNHSDISNEPKVTVTQIGNVIRFPQSDFGTTFSSLAYLYFVVLSLATAMLLDAAFSEYKGNLVPSSKN